MTITKKGNKVNKLFFISRFLSFALGFS